MSSKIRVMIVEDSRVVREFLQHIIRQDPRLEVVAAVGSAEQALRMLRRVSPDVISMDIRLPGMNGFEATQQIMAVQPTPIVVVSASVESDDLKISMNALRAGALVVLEKPVGTSHQDYEVLAERLCTQLAIMSQVRVIRQRFGADVSGATVSGAGSFDAASTDSDLADRPAGPFEVLGLVASTGGPKALQTILSGLPPDFPLPIATVQHIAVSFQGGFIDWLNDVCPLRVVEARSGDILRPGNVYIAPGDRHLRLAGGRCELDQGEPVCAQRPSGTVLFQSMADSLGSRALGVLLTGMGQDGADGLNAIRAAGGFTIAEHESTAVVYGMPAAAVAMNAVCESIPLQAIAPRIREIVSTRTEFDARRLLPRHAANGAAAHCKMERRP